MSWIRRLFSFTIDTDIGHLFLSFLPDRHEVKTYMGSVYFKELAEITLNPFWKSVLHDFSDVAMLQKDNIACQPLWKNYSILIDGKGVCFKTWCAKCIRFINDVLTSDGSFLSIIELENKFDIKINYLHYFSLRNAIRRGFDIRLYEKLVNLLFPEH